MKKFDVWLLLVISENKILLTEGESDARDCVEEQTKWGSKSRQQGTI